MEVSSLIILYIHNFGYKFLDDIGFEFQLLNMLISHNLIGLRKSVTLHKFHEQEP